jgi:hypothetical protein
MIHLNPQPVLEPVLRIRVGVSAIWPLGAAPNRQVTYFDAWHQTAPNRIYKLSEQYMDRQAWLEHDELGRTLFKWQGRLMRDSNLEMEGGLQIGLGAPYALGILRWTDTISALDRAR